MTRQRHGLVPSRKSGRSLLPRTDLREDFFWPIEDHFNRLLNEFFGGDAVVDSIKSSKGYPKMDVVREDNRWVVRAAMPGVPPENVKVEVLPDRRVRISGKMEESYTSPEGSTAVIQELRKSHFCREMLLPEDVVDDPVADLKDGILTLSWNVQKVVEEEPEIREIPINQPKND